MNLNMKNIHISNFMSIGEADIDLSQDGFTLVRGVNSNANDLASSNGSGKSSIWEAIAWVLTGETIRGSKSVTNIYGSDGALVELEFLVDGDEYIITRTKDHSKLKSSLSIKINGENKSGKGIRDSEKLLAQYLPDLTSELIGSVIILGQGLPQRFTNNTPSGRKEFLEKLSQSDFMIADLKARIEKRVADFNQQKRKIEDNNIKIKTEQQLLEIDKQNKQNTIDSLKPLDELNNQKAEVENQIAKLSNDNQNEINLIESIEEKINVVKTELNEAKLHEESKKAEIIKEFDDKIKPFEIERATIIANRINIDKEIQRKRAVTDVCPTCGQKLVGVEKPDITNDLKEFEELGKKIVDLNEIMASLETTKQDRIYAYHVGIREDYGVWNHQIETQEEELGVHTTNHYRLEKEIKEKNNELNKINNDIFISENNRHNLEKDISDIDIKLSNIADKILYNDTEMDKIDMHLLVLNRMSTLIKRDFRGYLLTNVIQYLDNKAKSYCQDVYNHNSIEFKLDGNNLSISINNREYEQLSGGEKQKVDIIIQLAIRDMLCKYMNFSSNIFVLDEIFDNLDDLGSEKILNLLSTRLQDVSSIYIVTHHSSIQIPVDREIVVVKDSTGISRVE